MKESLPRMLDASLLRTGDVLLSRSKDKVSTWIAKITGGHFSHASIYVSNYHVFEAVTEAVGYGSLEPIRLESRGHRFRALCSNSKFEEIALYRCPDLLRNPPGNNDTKLLFALDAIFRELNGSEYARGPHFNNVVPLPRIVPDSVKKFVLKTAGKAFLNDGEKILSQEYFCSELVSVVLHAVGLPILKNPPTCPSGISPNDLANPSISNLEEVPDFLCHPEPNAALMPDSFLMIEQMQARAISNRKIVKATKELRELTNRIMTQMSQRREVRWSRYGGMRKSR